MPVTKLGTGIQSPSHTFSAEYEWLYPPPQPEQRGLTPTKREMMAKLMRKTTQRATSKAEKDLTALEKTVADDAPKHCNAKALMNSSLVRAINGVLPCNAGHVCN